MIATDLTMKPETGYRSYLLRLWRGDEPGDDWHAMLESVTEPGERHYFNCLENLTAFLLTQQEDKQPEAEGDQ